jgi:hypothetical protein
MKIKLKLSEKQINALVYSFGVITKTPTKDRAVKVASSVLDKVALKFKKKQLDVQQGGNLFTRDKKHCFTLEIVEAHYLEQFTVLVIEHPLNDYDRNVLRYISNNLNQQLA